MGFKNKGGCTQAVLGRCGRYLYMGTVTVRS